MLLVQQAGQFLQEKLVWLRAGIVKTRNGKTQEEKRGQVFFGETPDTKIKEHGVWYSIDLTMNRDASLYLDTRDLTKMADRTHARQNRSEHASLTQAVWESRRWQVEPSASCSMISTVNF